MSMLVCVLAAATGVATADIAVGWLQTAPVWSEAGAGNVIAPGKAQLIWSATDTSGLLASTVFGGRATADEVILHSLDTAAAGQWTLGGATLVYDDSNVGGLDINAGYLFTRIFESTGSITVADNYITVTVWDPILATYTNPDLTVNAPFQTASVVLAPTGIDSQGTTVIPEPATLGLMGIAGLGLFLARKKVRS